MVDGVGSLGSKEFRGSICKKTEQFRHSKSLVDVDRLLVSYGTAGELLYLLHGKRKLRDSGRSTALSAMGF